MRRPQIESLGTVTTGTPSKSWANDGFSSNIVYVTTPSVSMTIQLQGSWDGGTTWVNVGAASAAIAAAGSAVFSNAPGLCRLTNSAGNSPMFVEKFTP